MGNVFIHKLCLCYNILKSTTAMNILKMVFFFIFIPVVKSIPYAATSQLPTNMQSKKVDLYTTATSNIVGATFPRPYDNSLTISTSAGYNPIGFISLSTLDFTPSSTEAFSCRSQTIGTTSITISCNIGSISTINKLSYYYAVFSSSEYIYPSGSNTYSHLVAEEADATSWSGASGNSYSVQKSCNLNSAAYHRSFIFLRGVEHLLNANYGMNLSATVLSSPGVYAMYFSFPPGIALNATSVTKVSVSVFILDVGYFDIKKNFIISEGISTFYAGSQSTTVLTGIDLSLNMLIVGVKSIYFHNTFSLGFSFSYSALDTLFPVDSMFSEIQYVWITVKSCGPGAYLDRVNSMCRTDRSGCPNFYQTISTGVASSISGIRLHSSFKIFAISTAYQIILYRYDGNSFLFYSSFLIPVQTSTIAKILLSPDFSRIAILCTGCGFFIYAWNGTNYASQYMLNLGADTFSDFAIRDDFKIFTIMYTKLGIQKHTSFSYNNQLRNYTAGLQLDASSAPTIFINYAKDQAYTISSSYLNFLKYDQNFKLYASYAARLSISQLGSTVTSTLSGNKKVLAVDFSRGSVNRGGIKIYQYSDTLEYFTPHSTIKSINMMAFSLANNLKLSYDGLKLIARSIMGSAQNIILFSRTSLTNEFTLQEIITQPQSTQEFDRTSGMIESSDNLQLILKVDSSNNIIVYYCQSSIINRTSIYQIPTASPLYTVVVPVSDQKIDMLSRQTSEEIASQTAQLKAQTAQLKTQTAQLKAQVADAQNTVNIILKVTFAVVSVLMVVVGLLVFKFIKDGRLSVEQGGENQPNREIQLSKKERIKDNTNLTINQDRENNSKASIAPQLYRQQNNSSNVTLNNLNQIQTRKNKDEVRNARKKKKKKDNIDFSQKSIEYQYELQLQN